MRRTISRPGSRCDLRRELNAVNGISATSEPVEGLDCWGMVAVTTMDLEIVGVSG